MKTTHRISHKERAALRCRIAASISGGMTVDQAAAEFGVSVGYVYLACREQNTSLPKKQHSQARIMRVIAAMLNTRQSLSAIAASEGVSRQWVWSIYRCAKDAGIPVHERLGGCQKQAQEI